MPTDEPNLKGQPPLIIAATEGYTDCVKLLLTRGALRTRKDSDGKTALYYAETANHADCADLLRSRR